MVFCSLDRIVYAIGISLTNPKEVDFVEVLVYENHLASRACHQALQNSDYTGLSRFLSDTEDHRHHAHHCLGPIPLSQWHLNEIRRSAWGGTTLLHLSRTFGYDPNKPLPHQTDHIKFPHQFIFHSPFPHSFLLLKPPIMFTLFSQDKRKRSSRKSKTKRRRR